MNNKLTDEQKQEVKECILDYIKILSNNIVGKIIIKIEPSSFDCADGNFIITMDDGTWVQFYAEGDDMAHIEWGIGKE